jgi:hypothetical protein
MGVRDGERQSVAHRGRKNADAALALALASGLTAGDAAERAGVAPRTAYRRLADAAFRAHVAELRAEMVGRALGKMADGMAEAADILRQLLRAEKESVRLGAARALLELTVRLRESVELEERVRVLEERLARGEKPT